MPAPEKISGPCFLPTLGDGRNWGSPKCARAGDLEVSSNLWTGVRGDAGAASVDDRDTVAERVDENRRIGAETFILSGHPNIEDAIRLAGLLIPKLPPGRAARASGRVVDAGPSGEFLSGSRQ